jgi:hypothetical protein
MSSQKKARGLPGMKEGPLVQMLDHQRVHAADEDKKLVDVSALAAERLVDATQEAEETATAAAAAAALSAPEEAQVSLSGSTAVRIRPRCDAPTTSHDPVPPPTPTLNVVRD